MIAIDEVMAAARVGLDDPLMSPDRASMPPILCGDFNAEPGSDEIRFLCGFHSLDDRTTFFQDVWRVAGDGGAGHTQDWWDNDLASMFNVHRKRIDYVFGGDPFLRRGSGGRVLHVQVVFDEPLTDVVASDHRGVLAEITWPL